MSLLRFFVSKAFWLNLVLAVITVALIVFGVLYYLNIYTRHGESYTVPDLRELDLEQAELKIEGSELRLSVVDSVYSDAYPRGAIVNQTPDPGSLVKEDRVIFLTVNSILPEMVAVPDLVGKSRRIAISLLDVLGIQIAEVKYVTDEACTDCVLEVLYNGKQLESGERIRKGDKITLVLGERSNIKVFVPDLIGLNFQEAREKLTANSLNMGSVLACEGCESAEDSLSAKIFQQFPDGNGREYVSLGSSIDVRATTDSSVFENNDSQTPDFDQP